MQRDAAALGVATSFAKLTDLTHPRARSVPSAPSGTPVAEHGLHPSFGLVSEIDRLSDRLRLLQTAVDRAARRAARRPPSAKSA